MEQVKMNFDEAIVAHAEWKLKLTLYLQGEGKFDHAIVCQDNQCKLGKWIYSDGKKYANEPAYEHLRQVHAKFHACAGSVIQAVDSKNIDDAKKMIASGNSYEEISATVINAISAVRRRVEEKTNLIMQNVNVGVMVIDKNMEIQSGYSAYCHQLFETDSIAGNKLCSVLTVDIRQAVHIAATISQIFDDVMPVDVSLSMLPERVKFRSKTIQIVATVVRGMANEIEYILLTLSDATRLETLEAENAENASLMKVLKNRESFVAFLKDAMTSLDHLITARPSQSEIRRDLHTIKGNSGMFDMNNIMAFVGKIEDLEKIEVESIKSVRSQLTQFIEKYGEILGVSLSDTADDKHIILESSLADIEAELDKAKTVDQAVAIVHNLTTKIRMRPIRSLLGPIEERVQALGSRLAKEVSCKVNGDDILVDPKRFTPVSQVLSHVLRNAVDHGIEEQIDREMAGKVGAGQITLNCSTSSDGTLLFSVSDDGRGINLEKLISKAAKNGVDTHENLLKRQRPDQLRLIFLDGVSTSNEVSDISGRGVGMGALLSAVESLGGMIHIESTEGVGTTLSITIPNATANEVRKAAA